MRTFLGYVTIGVLAVAAMSLATIAGLDLAVGARPLPERAIIQHVDRTHKGDRLDSRTIKSGARPAVKNIAVPVGCEPVFSPLVSAESPQISGRCVS